MKTGKRGTRYPSVLLVAILILACESHGFLARPMSRIAVQSASLYMSAESEKTTVTDTSSADAEFGDVCSTRITPQTSSILKEASVWDAQQAERLLSEQTARNQRNRSIVTAVVSVLLAVGNFAWQYTHPITPVQLLAEMQQSSAPVTAIGTNGKPSVVDFWAPWCENCKLAAPTLQKIEEEYRDRVNFVMVNGDQPQAWPYIEAFGVDAIPHMALVSAEGDVETALIGPIPRSVLEADLNAMIQNSQGEKQPLPYQMLDVFVNHPEKRRVHFDP